MRVDRAARGALRTLNGLAAPVLAPLREAENGHAGEPILGVDSTIFSHIEIQLSTYPSHPYTYICTFKRKATIGPSVLNGTELRLLALRSGAKAPPLRAKSRRSGPLIICRSIMYQVCEQKEG